MEDNLDEQLLLRIVTPLEVLGEGTLERACQ
jgi:hypothetical protein